MCCCGGRYTFKNSQVHLNNNLHQNYLVRINNIDNDYTFDEIGVLNSEVVS